MEKKEIIAESEFNRVIEALGCVSCELLKHSGFFNDMLVNGSNSDSQADEMKKFIESTDFVQKMLLICVTILGKSDGRTSEAMEDFFGSIVASLHPESDVEEMDILAGLASYFSTRLDNIEKPTERTKDTPFAIEVKPNGIKN